jgi:hypothetical protein
VDVVASDDTIWTLGGITKWVVVTRTGLVNVVLNDGSVHHGQRCDPETSHDTVDRWERNLALAEEWHQNLIDNRKEDNNGDWVEVLHQIVGNTMSGHLTTLSDEVVGELAVHNPVDGVETEDLASNEGALDFLDEVVIPAKCSSLAEASLVGWLCTVELAGLDHHPDNAEGVCNDGTLGRSNNVDFASEDEDQSSYEEDAQTQEECRPEIDIALHVRSCEQGEAADIDTEVEYHVDPLNGDSRVDNDALASLVVVTNDHLSALVLIGDKRSHVRLDTTSSETNNDNGHNETTKTSAVVKGRGDGCASEDEKTDDVNSAEDDDGVVLSKILISDDGT